MSLKTKLFSFLTAGIAVVAFSTFTFAQEDKATTPAPDKEKAGKHFKGEGRGMHKGRGEGKGFGHRHGGMMRMMHDLNLTEAQKTQMHSILEANRFDKATHEELSTLAKAKHAGTITAEQQARLDTLKGEMKAKAKSIHEQMLNVLTAEQKAQLEQKKAEMKQRKEERRQQREQRQKTPAATIETTKEN